MESEPKGRIKRNICPVGASIGIESKPPCGWYIFRWPKWYTFRWPVITLAVYNFDIGKAGSYHAVVMNWAGQEASDIAIITSILEPDPDVPVELSVGSFAGYFTFSIYGEIGRAYTVQVSEDLMTWETIMIQILITNDQEFVDWDSRNKTNRYFRVIY